MVSRLVLVLGTTLGTNLGTTLGTIHSTTLGTTHGTTHGTTNGTIHSTPNRFSSCTLPPYSDTSLPFHFYCITGIGFTYHPLLYHNHSAWIKIILLLLNLLIFSFHLKYAFLFSHCDTDISCPFAVHLPFVQSVIPSWHISTHLVLSDTLEDNVSCSRFFLYLSPHQLHSHPFFPR